VEERVKQPDCKNGFILDGFPRNTAQAEALDKLLAGMKMPLTIALTVDVEKGELMKRLTGRRTCKSCQQMYNIYFSPPKKEGVCDKCGGALFQRDDDKEETIKKRLDVYDSQTAPLISYYGKKNIMKTVMGVGSIDDIFKKVVALLEGK
jgi:adenylate kinase